MSDPIEVWWAAPADARPWHTGLLEPVEHERHRALLRPTDRLRFLTGAALARLAVAARLGRSPAELRVERRCERCGRPHGRPRFCVAAPTVPAADPAPSVSHSVSHSGDVVVVAVGGSDPVGVDVERVGGDDTGPLPPARLITDDPGCVDADDLVRVWVGKEAALKATGEGLAVAMTELTLPGGVGRVGRRGWPGPPVHVAALRAPAGYLAAVACVGAQPRAVAHRDGSALLAAAGTAGHG